MVKNETRLKIKKLGIDNNGEYEAKRFKYCYKHGIIIERIVLDMPQHSGIVEHMNQTLITRTRSLCL